MRVSTARLSRVAFLMIAPLALLAAQAQAQAPPMPSFSFSPSAPVAGVPVFFTNTTPGPLTNLTWSFGDPASGTDNHSFLPDPSHIFASPGNYTVLLTVANASASASVSRTITVTGGGGGGGGNPGGSCVASPTQLCLNNNRFAVTSAWTDPEGNTGSGNAVVLTSDSGYFWFFDPTNVELVSKVLNGCGVNDAYWVFASGLTNVGVTLLVVDTQTGAQYTFGNPQGVAFPPDQAIKAFPASCP